MSYQYIISRTLDPLFAVSIGLAAAATRIHREEREKGRGAAETVAVIRRRVGWWWEGEGVGK